MPTNLTDVNTFSATVAVPSDGESANSASLAAMSQTLANRTRNLKNRLDLVEGNVAAHEIMVPISALPTTDGDAFYVALSGRLSLATNSHTTALPLNALLRDGMVLSNARARVDPGAATATGTGCMRLVVGYWDYDGDLATPAETILADVYAADSSGAAQTLTDTIAAHVVALEGRDYWVRIKAADSATASPDSVYGIGLTVANPTSP